LEGPFCRVVGAVRSSHRRSGRQVVSRSWTHVFVRPRLRAGSKAQVQKKTCPSVHTLRLNRIAVCRREGVRNAYDRGERTTMQRSRPTESVGYGTKDSNRREPEPLHTCSLADLGMRAPGHSVGASPPGHWGPPSPPSPPSSPEPVIPGRARAARRRRRCRSGRHARRGPRGPREGQAGAAGELRADRALLFKLFSSRAAAAAQRMCAHCEATSGHFFFFFFVGPRFGPRF
jgi:hypothetical protein